MPGHVHPQLRRPWCPSLHVSGQTPHDFCGIHCISFLGGLGRLVMGTDRRTIEKNHAEGLVRASNLFKEALPYPKLRPSNEQLCGNPPETKLRWQGTPLRAVLMTPENRGDRPSKVLRWGLAIRTDFLDQRLPDGSCGIGKDRLHHAHYKQLCSPFCYSRPNRSWTDSAYAGTAKGRRRQIKRLVLRFSSQLNEQKIHVSRQTDVGRAMTKKCKDAIHPRWLVLPATEYYDLLSNYY